MTRPKNRSRDEMSSKALLSDEEYERLKKFLGLFYDWFEAKPSHPAGIHPLRVAEGIERQSRAQAKRGLDMAISDLVETSSDWSPSRVADADKRFIASGVPTLTMVRAKYSRTYKKILKRGFLKWIEEYYLVKGIIDGGGLLPGAVEADQLSAMMASFEATIPPRVENE